jgi:hypothetical protein
MVDFELFERDSGPVTAIRAAAISPEDPRSIPYFHTRSPAARPEIA